VHFRAPSEAGTFNCSSSCDSCPGLSSSAASRPTGLSDSGSVTATPSLLLPDGRRIGHRSRRVPTHPPRPRERCGRGSQPENTRPRPKPAPGPFSLRPKPENPYHCTVSGRLRLRACPRAEFYVNGNPLNLNDPNGHRPACDGGSDCTAVYAAYEQGQRVAAAYRVVEAVAEQNVKDLVIKLYTQSGVPGNPTQAAFIADIHKCEHGYGGGFCAGAADIANGATPQQAAQLASALCTGASDYASANEYCASGLAIPDPIANGILDSVATFGVAGLVRGGGGILANVLDSAAEDANVSGSSTVFRVLRAGEDPAAGLGSKDPLASYSEATHVRMGTRLSTQFISTTKDINVALKWAAISGNPIAAIDLGLVDSPIYDLSTAEGQQMFLAGNPIAQAYARSSLEILIEGPVQPGAVNPWVPGS
jgi:hypothetical protein